MVSWHQQQFSTWALIILLKKKNLGTRDKRYSKVAGKVPPTDLSSLILSKRNYINGLDSLTIFN